MEKSEGVWVDWIQRTQDGKTRHFEYDLTKDGKFLDFLSGYC
jgi:hypothetical protein